MTTYGLHGLLYAVKGILRLPLPPLRKPTVTHVGVISVIATGTNIARWTFSDTLSSITGTAPYSANAVGLKAAGLSPVTAAVGLGTTHLDLQYGAAPGTIVAGVAWTLDSANVTGFNFASGLTLSNDSGTLS